MHALIHPAEGKRLLMNNPNTTRRRAPEDSLKFTEFMITGDASITPIDKIANHNQYLYLLLPSH
jgi:hypothetical protein